MRSGLQRLHVAALSAAMFCCALLAMVPRDAGAVTAALTVEYIDPSGVWHRTAVEDDGSTTINCVAPCLVHFEGFESVSATETDDWERWLNIGYRLHYGESRSDTWSTNGLPRDEDTGPPVFGHAYENVGTFTPILKVRDSVGNEDTISLTVDVDAPAAATNVSSTTGAWPTITNGTHLSLNRGSDYTAKGDIIVEGTHNVLISAVGSGADPIISGISVRGASYAANSNFSDATPPVERPRHLRLHGIDVAEIGLWGIGHDFFGVINGRCRHYNRGLQDFTYTADVNTANRLGNLTIPRGTFLINCGTMVGAGYVVIDDITFGMHIKGVTLDGSGGGSDAHLLRGVFAHFDWRHNIFKMGSGTQTTYIKLQAAYMDDGNPYSWPTSTARMPYASAIAPPRRQYGYPTIHGAIQHNIFGQSGDTVSRGIGLSPENDDYPAKPKSDVRLIAAEDNVWFSSSSTAPVSATGYHIASRNNKYSMGAGGDVGINSPFLTRIYQHVSPLDESTNTRPVPTTFQAPGVIFSDSFTRANQTADDANWDIISGTYNIVGNQLVATSASGTRRELRTTTSAHAPVADSRVTAQLVTSVSGHDIAVGARMSGASGVENGYYANFYGANTVELYKIVGGSMSVLATRTQALSNGDSIGIEVTGTGAAVTIKILRNGVQLGADVTDTASDRIVAAGQTSILSWSDQTMDNFEAESL